MKNIATRNGSASLPHLLDPPLLCNMQWSSLNCLLLPVAYINTNAQLVRCKNGQTWPLFWTASFGTKGEVEIPGSMPFATGVDSLCEGIWYRVFFNGLQDRSRIRKGESPESSIWFIQHRTDYVKKICIFLWHFQDTQVNDPEAHKFHIDDKSRKIIRKIGRVSMSSLEWKEPFKST